ncbi:hypothetical protein B0T25DRAFT_567827 [Lasiosphaeria hispida]|uniref:Metallothionein-I gene transcription activator n=1 Tax=Lasiosphaeria hispida TaxID=260671 RepID=A0AAJ0HH12_9PEZI|nr:hypothetical protein B0T25DRAFT_567827 [Lasiosphaeria hispida]
MSREQYQIPTGSQQTFTGGAGNTAATTSREFDTGIMYYTCGDCAARVPLEKGAGIRCQKCGARVLYKERTKRMVQFEAR